jgi:hypothetical protein
VEGSVSRDNLTKYLSELAVLWGLGSSRKRPENVLVEIMSVAALCANS